MAEISIFNQNETIKAAIIAAQNNNEIPKIVDGDKQSMIDYCTKMNQIVGSEQFTVITTETHSINIKPLNE